MGRVVSFEHPIILKMTKSKSQKARAKATKNGRKVTFQQQKSKKTSKKTKRNRRRGLRPRSNPVGPGSMGRPRNLGGQNMMKGGNGGLGSTVTTRFRQTIEEDEYIGEVAGSVNFATTGYNINPGQSGTFPWGNKIAQLYERYDFDYLEFYLTSEVSAYATQGQTGVVVMSVDYDATDIAPTTKQQVLDTDPHTKPCLPSVQNPIRLILDCNEMRTSDAKYVRPGAQPANTDLKTYDAGILYVSTQGMANTTNFAQLCVRYRCHLKKPVLEASINQVSGVLHFSGTIPTSANIFATAAIQAGGSPVMAGGITLGSNTVIFGPGTQGNYALFLSVIAATSVTAIAVSGGTALNLFTTASARDNDNYAYSATSGAGTSSSFNSLTVTIPAAGATITYVAPTITGGGTGMDLFVVALPSTLLTVEEKLEAEYERRERVLMERLDRLEFMLSHQPRIDTLSASEDDELLVQQVSAATDTSSFPPRRKKMRPSPEAASLLQYQQESPNVSQSTSSPPVANSDGKKPGWFRG